MSVIQSSNDIYCMACIDSGKLVDDKVLLYNKKVWVEFCFAVENLFVRMEKVINRLWRIK